MTTVEEKVQKAVTLLEEATSQAYNMGPCKAEELLGLEMVLEAVHNWFPQRSVAS